MYFSLKKENTQMAENSRKNEFFERESIAIIAINRDYDNPYFAFPAVYTNRWTTGNRK